MIVEFIGMDLVNFFMYDGGIVFVEVVMLVSGYIKCKKIFIFGVVYLESSNVLKIYVIG